jgi:isopentenyldiphosphate isomerase
MNSDNLNELLPEVDEEGRVIGQVTRGRAHAGKELKPLHPVVHLHLFNPKCELYLQHRPSWKDTQPDKWDTAVGGHIDFGEDVMSALQREIREELGLDMEKSRIDVIPITKYVFNCLRERELVYVFKTVSDLKPSPSEELEGGRYFSREEIIENMGKDFFTPNFEQEWKRLFI